MKIILASSTLEPLRERKEIAFPPSLRSTAAWRESPISHSTGSSKPPYNTNGGPATAGERGDARNGAESDRKVQNGATDVPQFREPRIPSLQSLVTGCPGIKINIC